MKNLIEDDYEVMDSNKKKRIAKKLITIFAPGVIVVVILFVFLRFMSGFFFPKENNDVTDITIKNRFGPIQELVTYEYTNTIVETNESSKELFGLALPFTSKRVIIVGKSVIKIGFDFEQISPEVDNNKKLIYIDLPEPEVTDNYIEIIKCIEDNNLFNPVSNEETQNYLNNLKEKKLKEAEDEGIFEKAEENAKKVIENIYSDIDGYQIRFR